MFGSESGGRGDGNPVQSSWFDRGCAAHGASACGDHGGASVVYARQCQTLLSAPAARLGSRHPAVDDALSKRRLKNDSSV